MKRDASRPLNDCSPLGPGYTFAASVCTTHGTAQSYRIICYRPGEQEGGVVFPLRGECNENEICVDGPTVGTHTWAPGTAYCVSKSNFIKLIRTGTTEEGQVGFDQPEGSTPLQAAEAVLTGPDGKSSVQANRIDLHALKFDTCFPGGTWRAVVNGTKSCQDCSSLDMSPIPPGTKRLNALVSVKPMTEAFLYLATV
ncbi:hypothetical protein MMC24_006855 [Lignoscripta atroalba]|nr:hypothetical protein [Lignoscripta atroalba]